MAEGAPRIERWNPAAGAPDEAALRDRLAGWGYRATRHVYPPGTYFQPHTHAVDKCDAVLAGRFRLCLGQFEAVLEAGDCIFIPQGAVHSAEVVGGASVISLDGIANQNF